MQPTILVGLAVEIGVEIAIGLDAVFEVAPSVDDIVPVGVGKLPQHGAARAADDPGRVARDLFGLDRALVDLVLLGVVEGDIALQRLKFQCIGHFGRGALGGVKRETTGGRKERRNKRKSASHGNGRGLRVEGRGSRGGGDRWLSYLVYSDARRVGARAILWSEAGLGLARFSRRGPCMGQHPSRHDGYGTRGR